MEAFLPYWLQRRRNKKMLRRVQKRRALEGLELPLAEQVRLEADMSTYLVRPGLPQLSRRIENQSVNGVPASLRGRLTTTWSCSCSSATSASSPASTLWLRSWWSSTT